MRSVIGTRVGVGTLVEVEVGGMVGVKVGIGVSVGAGKAVLLV